MSYYRVAQANLTIWIAYNSQISLSNPVFNKISGNTEVKDFKKYLLDFGNGEMIFENLLFAKSDTLQVAQTTLWYGNEHMIR